jgi:hypothetical protein
MPSPIAVVDLLSSAARLAGVLADGETLTSNEYTDCLRVLNDMLEDWSTEKLSVYGAQNQSFNTVANQASYTIGSGGNFNTQRPTLGIIDAYVTLGGVDSPVEVVDQNRWNMIGLKSQGGIPEKLLYVGDFPLGRISLWPVPSDVMPLVLTMARTLTFPVALADTLSGPPGMMKALRTCTAVEICPEFGAAASADLIAIAVDAKGDFKRANQQSTLPVAGYDAGLLQGGVVDWRSGY